MRASLIFPFKAGVTSIKSHPRVVHDDKQLKRKLAIKGPNEYSQSALTSSPLSRANSSHYTAHTIRRKKRLFSF